jgi:hypothetical protein
MTTNTIGTKAIWQWQRDLNSLPLETRVAIGRARQAALKGLEADGIQVWHTGRNDGYYIIEAAIAAA